MNAPYFAQINTKGAVLAVTDAFPPQKLTENQFEISEQEYRMISLLGAKFSVDEAISLLMSFDEKRRKHVAGLQPK